MVKEKIVYETDYGKVISSCIVCIIVTVIIILIVIHAQGGFDSPIDELGLDKDKIVREYVLKYYPEYTNCSIEWSMDVTPYLNNKPGVNIYCEQLDDRDGLKIVKERNPDYQIEFQDVTPEDALVELIKDRMMITKRTSETD